MRRARQREQATAVLAGFPDRMVDSGTSGAIWRRRRNLKRTRVRRVVRRPRHQAIGMEVLQLVGVVQRWSRGKPIA
jgi:hypothetical protein